MFRLPNISIFNVLTVYLIQFIITIVFTFIVGFSPFILEDSNIYDIPKAKVGGVLGDIGFITQILIIFGDVILGPIMDIFGRKLPTSIGFIIAGISLMIIPYG